MSLELAFIGPIARPEAAAVEAALQQATTVAELLAALGYARHQLRFIRVAEGERLMRLHEPLPTSGRLVLSVPMGGG